MYYIYLLASKRNGTIYTGVTNDLKRRVFEHKNGIYGGFTSKYMVFTLVYYESTRNVHSALKREKQIKNWKRSWKMSLIEKDNPQWKEILL